MTFKSLLLPAFFAAALLTPPSLALEPAGEAHARTVEIDRASLSTEAGADRAYARIRLAARAACRAENRGGAASDRGVRLCVEDTFARTLEEIDAPPLTALHELRQAKRRLASLN
ncbi:MAG: UrcA family protein [Oceanicaulis sp.]